jgi:hypothetical protein
MTVLATGSRRHLGMPLTAALAAGAVVLAGCQSDADPPVATTSPGSSSPSASPSTSSPTPSQSPSVEIPAAAREKSEKGAEAFVRYFFDQVNAAWTTPDPILIEQLSDAGCKSCAALISTARDLKSKSQRYDSPPISIRSVAAVPGAPGSQQYIEAKLIQNATDVINADGAVVLSDRKSPFDRTVALRWRGGRWLVYDVA